jgi:hypothetical protein
MQKAERERILQDAVAAVAAGSGSSGSFLDVMDKIAGQEAKWKRFKVQEILRFLRIQGYPDPVGDLEQRAAVYKRAYLERFLGANWEEFFKWDGVRVLHFAGRVRPHPKTGEMVRVVRRLYREVPDAV